MTFSFHDRLIQHADKQPEHPAVVTESLTWSYRELLSRAIQGAHYLREQGIAPDSIVGITLDDEAEHFVATLALIVLGAGQTGQATHDPMPVRAQIAERIGQTHTLSSDETHLIPGTRYVAWPPPSADRTKDVAAAEGSRFFLRTSGTTGKMNIIVFNEEQFAVQAERHPDYPGQRLLRLATIEYNTSKRHRLYCLWNGGTNVFRSRTMSCDVDYLLRLKVTCVDISRMHASEMASSPDGARLQGMQIRPGGSAVPKDVRAHIIKNATREFFVRYATTETGAISMAGPEDHDEDETVGVPIPGNTVEIVDDTDQPLPAGERGSIRLRIPGMATGYLNSPADTAKRFRDGWFYPGDAGTLRADGQLIIQGRVDDMMILNGVNIFPAEIEQVLEQHPDVAHAIALALESPVHGHIPVAVVQLKPGATITMMALLTHAKERLTMRAPRKILFLDSIPQDGQGKISRRKLRDLFQIGSK